MYKSHFTPARNSGQRVTSGAASATITIGKGNGAIRAVNLGATPAYFVTYDSTVETRVATVADTVLNGTAAGIGSDIVIDKAREHDTLAYIADSGTPVLHFQAGEIA